MATDYKLTWDKRDGFGWWKKRCRARWDDHDREARTAAHDLRNLPMVITDHPDEWTEEQKLEAQLAVLKCQFPASEEELFHVQTCEETYNRLTKEAE